MFFADFSMQLKDKYCSFFRSITAVSTGNLSGNLFLLVCELGPKTGPVAKVSSGAKAGHLILTAG